MAAPRLVAPPAISAVEAEGKYAIVDGAACEELVATFSIHGKRATAYTVELYVEGNSTGERAVLVQTTSVTTDNPPGQVVGTAGGRIEAGTPSSRIQGHAPLPNVAKGTGWAFCLVLKEGDRVVASTSFSWVAYAGKPD
jgi:hypothetical protein